MTPPLTPEELAAIEVRVNAATSDPWTYDGYNRVFADKGRKIVADVPDHPQDGDWGSAEIRTPEASKDRETWYRESACNAWFIQHARTDIPRLIAELKQARAEIEYLHQIAANGYGDICREED